MSISKAEREDFAARVRGDHQDDNAWRAYVLAELRLAYRRAKLHMEAIKEAAKLIEGGGDVEQALSCLGDAIDYVVATPVDDRIRKIERLLEYLPGINDERDSIPLLLSIKHAMEGTDDDAGAASEPESERELLVRDRGAEVHGYDIPNRGGAGSGAVSQREQGGEHGGHERA